MAAKESTRLRMARRATAFLSIVATLTGLVGFSPAADAAAGSASVSITPATATTPSGAPVTFTLSVSCSVTGGCKGTVVKFPSTEITGNGATKDFAAWFSNVDCKPMSASGGVVTFTYGAVDTGASQCKFTVGPPNYKTLNGTQVTLRPTISGSNFGASPGAPATLTVTAGRNASQLKTSPKEVVSGLPFAYTVRFSCGRFNSPGDLGLSALNITDVLPANFTYSSYTEPKKLPGTFTYDAATRTLTYADATGQTCGNPSLYAPNTKEVHFNVNGEAATDGVPEPTGKKICNQATARFTYIDGTTDTSTSPSTSACPTVAGRVPADFLRKAGTTFTFLNVGQYRFPPDTKKYPYTYPGDWDGSKRTVQYSISLSTTVTNAGAAFAVQDPLPCLTNLAGQVYTSNPRPGAPYCTAPAFVPTFITATGFTPSPSNAVTLVYTDGTKGTVNYQSAKAGWVIPTSPTVAELDFPAFPEEGKNTATIVFGVFGYAAPGTAAAVASPGTATLVRNTAFVQAYQVGSTTPLVPERSWVADIMVVSPTSPSGTFVRPLLRSAHVASTCKANVGFASSYAAFFTSVEIASAPSQAIYFDYLAPPGATIDNKTEIPFTLTQLNSQPGQGYQMRSFEGSQKVITDPISPKVTQNYNGTDRTLYQWVIPAGKIPRPGAWGIHPGFSGGEVSLILPPGCAGTYQNDLTVGYGAPVTGCYYGYYGTEKILPAPTNPDKNNDLQTNATPVPNSYCGISAPITVPVAAGVNPGFRVDKTVQGNLDAAPVSSGGIGNVSPSGGSATYNVTFTNSGGANLADPVLYDILPNVGDTAASSVTPRNSRFPVAFTGVGALPSGVTVSYSQAANPCRPEVLALNPGCVNDWSTTPPSPLSSVTALRFAYRGTVVVKGAPGTNSFTVPFTVATPSSAPGQVAWNSVGTTAFIGAGGSLMSAAESSVTGLQTQIGPAIVKAATTAAYSEPGDTIGYTFTVTNNTAVPLTDVGVIDDLVGVSADAVAPAVSCRSLSSPAGPCSGATTTLQPNQSATFVATYGATQGDLDRGSIADLAIVSGTPPTGGALTNTSNTVTVPAVQTTGLSLSKSADRTTLTTAGENVRYSYTVTNRGNVTLTGVTVTETAFTGTGPPPVITCPVSSLGPNTATTCTAGYTATQPDVDRGSIVNTAVASATPPTGPPVTSPPTTATVTVPADPALRIVKSASPAEAESFSAGQLITYSYVVTNTGNVTLTNASVDDTAFTGHGPTPVPQCPAQSSTLAPDDQMTCTATYHLMQADIDAGSLTNAASAAGDPPAGPPVIAAASSVTIPQNPRPALTLLKTAAPETLTAAGEEVTYTFLVTNTGNVTLAKPAVTEGAFTGTGSPPEVSCPSATGPMPPGGQVTCTATYTATQADVDAGHITNTAGATATPPSGPAITSSDSSATVTAPGSGLLRVVISASPAEATAFKAGEVLTYSYVVTNAGNVTIGSLAVDETTFTGGGAAPVAQCPSTTLAPGAQMTCTATYALTQADIDAGSVANVAIATGESPTGGKVFAAASSVTIPERRTPALTVVKTADPTTITAAGQEVTYRFLVTNTGNVSLTGVTVQENGFSGTGPAPVPSCPASLAPMLPGIEVACTAEYTATAADVAAGSITNTASATAAPRSAAASTSPPAAAASTSPPSTVTVTAAGNPAAEPAGSVSVLPGSLSRLPAGAVLPVTGSAVVGDLLRAALALILGGTALGAAGRRRKVGP